MIGLQSTMGVLALALGAADDHRRRRALARLPAGPAARADQLLREPGPAGVRAGDGRARRPAQRGQPQLGAGERRPRGRARPIAGLVIAAGGIGLCFLLNAASFVAVVASLIRMDTAALRPSVPTPRAPGQLREGLAYVRSTPALAVPLLMMTLVGCLAYEFQVVLPIVASETFGGDARSLRVPDRGDGRSARWSAGCGWRPAGAPGCPRWSGRRRCSRLAMPRPRLAPNLLLALVAMGLVGAASVAFLSMSNSTLQLAADPAHAGPGDGAVGGGVPRLHADRRPDRRGGQSSTSAAAPGWRWARWRAWPRRAWGCW